ncbi:hypothetical protein [Novipirellula herctigrandis]
MKTLLDQPIDIGRVGFGFRIQAADVAIALVVGVDDQRVRIGGGRNEGC